MDFSFLRKLNTEVIKSLVRIVLLAISAVCLTVAFLFIRFDFGGEAMKLYLASRLPSGEIVTSIVLLLTGFAAGLAVTALLYSGHRCGGFAVADAAIKLCVAVYFYSFFGDIHAISLVFVAAAVYLLLSAALFVSEKADMRRKQRLFYATENKNFIS